MDLIRPDSFVIEFIEHLVDDLVSLFRQICKLLHSAVK